MRRFNSHRIIVARLLAFAIFLFAAQAGWAQAEKEGLANFGQVTNLLYRGAQPTSTGFTALQKMGIGMVVNFRNEPEETSAEKREVESLGMKYIGIPWSAIGTPSDAQILQFLDLVRSNSQTKIFVHCRRGADRTGTMIAAYRIAIEHKPVADAVSEMNKFHYAHFFLPHLQRYIASLPHLLQADSLYSAYAPAMTTNPGAAASVTAAGSIVGMSLAQ